MYNDGGYSQQGYTVGYSPATNNNPFLDSGDSNAANRWPDLSQDIPQASQASWQQQQQPTSMPSSSAYQDVFPGGGNWKVGPPNPPGYTPPMPQIPHNSQYWRLLQQHGQAQAMGAMPPSPSYSSPNPMNNFAQSQSYNPQFGQYDGANSGVYANSGVAQFDPMMNPTPQSQNWGQQNPSQQIFDANQQHPSYQTSPQFSTGTFNLTSPPTSQAQEHPRDFIQKNKAYLESREEYYWKQALNAFDALEDAWAKRLQQLQMEQQSLRQYGQNGSQYDNYIRTAQACRDATASCKFQMKEVKSGYHLSNNNESRERVRQALNAGVKDLPGWP